MAPPPNVTLRKEGTSQVEPFESAQNWGKGSLPKRNPRIDMTPLIPVPQTLVHNYRPTKNKLPPRPTDHSLIFSFSHDQNNIRPCSKDRALRKVTASW